MAVTKLKPKMTKSNEFDVEGEAKIYRSMRHFWHVVAYSHQVTEKPIAFTLCDQDIVIVRMGGEVCVFDDLCPHRGTRLSLGSVKDGCKLECAYHGWQFNPAGELTLAPQRPDLAGHLRAHVRKYKAAEKFDMVWVCLEDKPHYPLPYFTWGLPDRPNSNYIENLWGDPAFHHVTVPTDDWSASAPRRIENYTDYSHFPILHDKYLGDRTQPEVPSHEVWRHENVLENYQQEGTWIRVPIDTAAWGGKELPPDPYIKMKLDWRVFMPLTCTYNITFNDGNRYTLIFHPTPMTAKKFRNFTVSTRDFGDPAQKEKELGEFVTFIYNQDKVVVELQRPEELPEDLTKEMHVKGVDTYSVEYRMWLMELANELVG